MEGDGEKTEGKKKKKRGRLLTRFPSSKWLLALLAPGGTLHALTNVRLFALSAEVMLLVLHTSLCCCETKYGELQLYWTMLTMRLYAQSGVEGKHFKLGEASQTGSPDRKRLLRILLTDGYRKE